MKLYTIGLFAGLMFSGHVGAQSRCPNGFGCGAKIEVQAIPTEVSAIFKNVGEAAQYRNSQFKDCRISQPQKKVVLNLETGKAEFFVEVAGELGWRFPAYKVSQECVDLLIAAMASASPGSAIKVGGVDVKNSARQGALGTATSR